MDNVAEVCIIKENIACESCFACPKKMGVRDVIKTAAVKGVQVGQEVILCENTNWFIKNRIMFVIIAFVSGIIITETIPKLVSFGAHRGGMDLLGGGILTIVTLIVSWIKKPKYTFRIERIKGGNT